MRQWAQPNGTVTCISCGCAWTPPRAAEAARWHRARAADGDVKEEPWVDEPNVDRWYGPCPQCTVSNTAGPDGAVACTACGHAWTAPGAAEAARPPRAAEAAHHEEEEEEGDEEGEEEEEDDEADAKAAYNRRRDERA